MLTGDRPLCSCHGQPTYWNRDPRRSRGGYWRCAVLQRERVSRRYAADPDKKAAQLKSYYHERGGWLKKRRRDLAAQRGQILARLDSLREEAERC